MSGELPVFEPDGDTLVEFMLDRSPVKIIQGPIGCLSGETEFLTLGGWRRIDSWRPGDVVAEWDPGSGALSYREPLGYVNAECGEMWHFSNAHSLSMMVSDEHRVALYDWRGRFVVRDAASVAARPSRYRVPVTFLPPAGAGLAMSLDWIRLSVAVKADGCFPKAGHQVVVTVRKDRKKARLRELLSACGVEWRERVHATRPSEVTFTFSRAGLSKRYGPEWWGASREQLEVVISECRLWDGLADGDDDRFFTTHEADADFIQYAAHATGRRATISRRVDERSADWAPAYTVHITRPGSAKGSVGLRVDCTNIERVPAPGGRKYCFTTRTGFFVARHAGRVFVTGNSGKSLACLMDIFFRALEQPVQADGKIRCRAHVFRESYPKLEGTTIKSWLEWFPEDRFGRFYWSKPFLHEIRVGPLELDVHFVALEDERAVEFFRSLETTFCYFNELQYTPKVLFDEATSRVGRYPRQIDGGAVNPGVIADMNAPDELHWVPMMRGDVVIPDWFDDDQRQGLAKPANWKFFVQPAGLIEVKGDDGKVRGYAPNPDAENTRYTPGGAAYYTEAAKGKTKSWIDANILNRVSPRRHGKPVYGDFARELHVASKPIEPVPGVPLIIGCDFGRRPCAIIGQYVRGRWFVIHELIARDMGADAFAPLLKKELATRFPGYQFAIWGDPSGDFKGQNDNQTPYQIFRKHGLPVQPAPSNVFTVRLQAFEAVLTRLVDKQPGILISPTCTTFIAACDGGYHYRRLNTGGERYTDMPEKDQYSDPADAGQYMVLGGGEGRLLLTGSTQGASGPVNAPMRAFNPLKTLPAQGMRHRVRGW